ncbi:MAG: MarR family winged helix-turn-helix transcriptional regulator [Ktedonobacteraceae bacterium]
MHQNTIGDISLSEYQALAEIRYQIRRFLSFSEHMARAAGLQSQQHQALLALKGTPEGGQPTVSYLAERLQLQHHSTVELINRLAENNYVRRRRDEVDQRRVIVELTEHGEEVLRKLTLAHRDELQSTGPALVRALNAVVASDAHQADAGQDARIQAKEGRH